MTTTVSYPASSEIEQTTLDSIRSPLHESLLGISPAIREVTEMVRRLAASNLTVLITGESGVGKDIAARLLHKLSPRYGNPFVKVNCPAIPESILESELFGYERGAFTGAGASKPGRLELAHNGTIFLDEIAETSYTVQSKLLQVLDGEPFMRIGGVTPVRTDVRIIAATNMSLEAAVREGRMREDIYFRLSEVIIHMPALRERREDIPLLAEHFNYNLCKRTGREYEPIPPHLIERIQQFPWPGNIRELAAHVKKYVATRDPQALLEGDAKPVSGRVSEVLRPPAPVREETEETAKRKFISLKEATRRTVEATEQALIREALRYTLWNRRKAAKLLDISYSSLLRRIEAYNIGKSESE
ncbi:MAG: sigma-54-dependent Fis family transcriptional regulator [Candidatus Hydrogenedentes bacterium]|nr:sigma-54-dependent Fis family transcriptional regulator [Candidatus Hydrogenedentota bacterium]